MEPLEGVLARLEQHRAQGGAQRQRVDRRDRHRHRDGHHDPDGVFRGEEHDGVEGETHRGEHREGADQQHVGGLLLGLHPLAADLLGQRRQGLGDAVLHLDLGQVRIGADIEGDRQL